MKTHNTFRKSRVALTLCLTLASASSGATWYKGSIRQVVPQQNGDVVVQVDPGKGESRYSERSRVFIDGTDPGGNKLMATVLTAVALRSEITFNVASVPSFGAPQVITGIGLVSP